MMTGPQTEIEIKALWRAVHAMQESQTTRIARHARPVGGGGGLAGIGLVRGWSSDTGRVVDVSLVSEADDNLWQVKADSTIEIHCQPSMRAKRDYEIFQWIGTGASFPHVLSDQEAAAVLPIFLVGSRRVIWAIPAFGVPPDLDPDMPTTEGRPAGPSVDFSP